jgi:hypothetical protein
MFELIGLFVAITAIAALARGRGASPVVAGVAAGGGWFLIEYGGMFLLPKGQSPFVLMLIAWAWIAAVAGFLRFVVGSRRAQPDGQWICSNCRYWNNASSVICEACKQPWQAPDPAVR